MNEEIGKRRAAELKDSFVSGWKIGDYLGFGKTAFVCKAKKGDGVAAIKLFESNFLSEKDIEELKMRLKRQLLLRDKRHPNLVEIYDAGYDSSASCYFLVMQYLEAAPLSKLIQDIPRSSIGPLVSQIADAANFLENLDLAHRDIKPDNIVVTPDFTKAILLDLGVIRPLGKNEITDSTNTLRFVGTLRYSSPEFLFRTEEDTKEGWRAVTFYQIGAVLHDMIMRTPIFQGLTDPFAKLVHAIQYESPPLYCDDVDSALIQVARVCLLKPPSLRLRILNWESFLFTRDQSRNIEKVKERIRQRKETSSCDENSEMDYTSKNTRAARQLLYDVEQLIDRNVRSICIGNDVFPKLAITHCPTNAQFDLCSTIVFSKSKKHSLTSDLSIAITSSLVDFNSHLIQLQCVGLLQGKIDLNSCAQYLSIFYEGFMDDPQLQSSIEDMLHIILDNAQLKCDAHSTLPTGKQPDNPWVIYKIDKEEAKNG